MTVNEESLCLGHSFVFHVIDKLINNEIMGGLISSANNGYFQLGF